MSDDPNKPDPAPPDAPPPAPPPPPPPSLAYMRPRQDEEMLTRERHFRVAGAVLSTLSVIGLVFVFIICQLPGAFNGRPAPGVQTYGVPAACAGVVVAVLGGIAWYQWRTHRSRAFAIGVLIGVGIAVLIEGACLASMGR